MMKTRRSQIDGAGQFQRARDVDDDAIMTEAERLLGGRTRDIRLEGDMKAYFRARTFPQSSMIIRAWMGWVMALDVFAFGLNLMFLPREAGIQSLVPGLFILLAAGAVFIVWSGRGVPVVQELALTAGMFVILFSIALVGPIGGAAVYERYLNVMLFVATTAIVIFGVPIAWTWAIAITALCLYAGFQLWNPAIDLWEAMATTLFFGSGLVGTAIARRTVTILAQKSFLLGLRDLRRVSELAEANARLETLARTDPLTGVANRRWMTETLDGLWQGGTPARTAILMCDVDHFKGLNDALGHLEGDRCLREVANVIRDCIRPGLDQVARYGGEEFLVLLTGVDVFDATLAAERICRTMEASLLPNPGSGVSRYLTTSIGVAVSDGTGQTPEQLQRQADEALYRAKSEGRNRVVVHDGRPAPGRLLAAVR